MAKKSSPEVTDSQKGTEESQGATKKVAMAIFDPFEETLQKGEKPSLTKSILNVLNGSNNSIERLAFEEDPSNYSQYQGLYKQKIRLIPDSVLKRIAIQDDLVAAIVNARANQIGTFGRPRPDRFSLGYAIEPKEGLLDKLNQQQKDQLQKRIAEATARFETCGSTSGWDDDERLTFSQYLSMSTKNAVVVGRIATEIIWQTNPYTGKEEFHSFRPIDAGTIFKAAPQKEAAQSVREQARFLLETVKNKRLVPERFQADEYAWVQAIESRPLQAFTSKECVVHNFYPVADVELDGYPVTPLDTVISAVTTHINITTHNKLYFQSGRATRGMIVIRSDDLDEGVISRIRQQFNASINSVQNSWRMPVFGIGSEDDLAWQSIDSGGRDMEFQYLSDSNARVILSAFQMSPEELPGYSHLSRGTNSQSLSESNQEYLLTAHRDIGIRPLLMQWQDFINASLFPLIDEELAQICTFKLVGLEADSAEKESARLQQDAPVHMTYNELLSKVEKKQIAHDLGGDVPFNPAYQGVLDKYVTVGVIRERFLGIEGASQDPQFAYVRDPYWFQMQQLMLQKQQLEAAQAQQQAMLQSPQGPDAQEGGMAEDPVDAKEVAAQTRLNQNVAFERDGSQEKENSQQSMPGPEDGQDINTALDDAQRMFQKSEAKLPPNGRRVLEQQKMVVDRFLTGWERASQDVIKEIIKIADIHAPKHKK